MKNEYLECGKILAPHGVRGLMKIESWCDSPKVLTKQKRIFLAAGGGYKELLVESAAPHGTLALMKLSGIDDRETVQAMKNVTLYLKREDIPLAPGSFFLADLIGIDCIDYHSGKCYGTVSDITDGAAGRLYHIRTENGGEVLIPDVPQFIKEIDTERGLIITPIPGFFD